MLYDGKRPEELTEEEIEAAVVYCARQKFLAAQMFELNDAGIQELSQEYARRHGYTLEPEECAPDGTTIN